MWSRWQVWVVLGCLALAACAPAPSTGGAAAGAPRAASSTASPAASPADDVTVVLAASQNVTPNVAIWLTHDLDLFAKNGVAVDLQSISATVAIKALVAGQLNGVYLGSPEVVAARAAGTPVTIVAVFVPLYNDKFMVPPRLASVEQVRGQTVGVIAHTTINGVGTVRALRAFGLEAGRDYTVVETGAAGTYQALTGQLLARNVDAAALEPGVARKAAAEGYQELFDLASMDLPVASSSLAFQTEFVQQYPGAVQKVVDSLIQGVRHARQHRADTLAAYQKYFKITDPTELELTYDRVVGRLLTLPPYPAVEQFPETIEAMARDNPAIRSVDVAALIDRRFVDDAVRRGLTD